MFSTAGFQSRTHTSVAAPTVSSPKRCKTIMHPVGVPRVPYRLPRSNYWAWVDIWNCLYRERIVFLSKVRCTLVLLAQLAPHAACQYLVPSGITPDAQLNGSTSILVVQGDLCHVCAWASSHHPLDGACLSAVRLYTSRVVTSLQAVDDELGNTLVATMLYLDSENKKDINMYINASGGDVVPCLALHDTMKHIGSDVGTVGFGGVMGMAGFLLACGAPHSHPALLHAVSVTARSSATMVLLRLAGPVVHGLSLHSSYSCPMHTCLWLHNPRYLRGGACMREHGVVSMDDVQVRRASAMRSSTPASCCIIPQA